MTPDPSLTGQQLEGMPRTLGLCLDPAHTGEFYVPDPKPGDKCPQCPETLVIFHPAQPSGQQLEEAVADRVVDAAERAWHDLYPSKAFPAELGDAIHAAAVDAHRPDTPTGRLDYNGGDWWELRVDGKGVGFVRIVDGVLVEDDAHRPVVEADEDLDARAAKALRLWCGDEDGPIRPEELREALADAGLVVVAKEDQLTADEAKLVLECAEDFDTRLGHEDDDDFDAAEGALALSAAAKLRRLANRRGPDG